MEKTVSLGLGLAERLRRSRDFRAVYDRGRRFVARYFVAFVLEKEKGPLRVGVVASRRVGGAVERNRAKRLLREAFRRNRPGRRASADVVLVARASINDIGYDDLVAVYGRSMRQWFDDKRG